MASNSLSAIKGIEIFPIISLIIFIVLFSVAIIWVLRLKKDYLNEMSELPLIDTIETNEKGTQNV